MLKLCNSKSLFKERSSEKNRFPFQNVWKLWYTWNEAREIHSNVIFSIKIYAMNNMCCYHKTIFLSFTIHDRKERKKISPTFIFSISVLNEARLLANEFEGKKHLYGNYFWAWKLFSSFACFGEHKFAVFFCKYRVCNHLKGH